jgi:membrane-associated phospholipid phosphatase
MSHEKRHREWLVNAGAAVDSVAVTVMATQLATYAVRRERPRSNPCLAGNETEADRNLSFFSGHTSIAFAVVASARETARLRGRSTNNWLLAGSAAAALTGYFRVAGDRHHLTDVLAGAGVGIVVGTLVPRHLHRPKPGLAPSGLSPQAASSMTQPVVGITRPLETGGRRFLVHVGKGPGKSLQLGLSF